VNIVLANEDTAEGRAKAIAAIEAKAKEIAGK
jgi:tryptophan synthase alpha chain